jgi:hypothetical protein
MARVSKSDNVKGIAFNAVRRTRRHHIVRSTVGDRPRGTLFAGSYIPLAQSEWQCLQQRIAGIEVVVDGDLRRQIVRQFNCRRPLIGIKMLAAPFSMAVSTTATGRIFLVISLVLIGHGGMDLAPT